MSREGLAVDIGQRCCGVGGDFGWSVRKGQIEQRNRLVGRRSIGFLEIWSRTFGVSGTE